MPRKLLFLSLIFTLWLTACGAQTPSSSWPGLAADDQRAYLAFNQQVYAIDLETGKPAWANPFPATIGSNTDHFFADPGLGSEMLIVGSEGPTSSHSGVLYGLDPATGQQKWCLAFDSKGAERQKCPLAEGGTQAGLFGIAPPSDNRIIAGVTVDNGVAYVGLTNGAMYAVEATSGQVQWHFVTDIHALWATPVVSTDLVFVASLDHKLYARHRDTGEEAWTEDLGSSIAGTPALAGDLLYVGTFAGKLHALDTRTGQEKWVAQAENWVWGGPVVAEGAVYFTDIDGNVFAVDAQSGTQKWKVKPGDVLRAAPLVHAGVLYVGDKSGKLFALNANDGTSKWPAPIEIGGQLLGNPVLAGDNILITSYQGANLLSAYSPEGLLKWPFTPSK